MINNQAWKERKINRADTVEFVIGCVALATLIGGLITFFVILS